MRTSENINEIAKALSKFQSEVKNPTNSAVNPQFRSKYAPLEVVINTVKPVLADNGLSFIQSTGSEGESISVVTLLMHESGQWIESDPLVLPAYQTKKGNEKEFNAQGAGSSISYGRRYSLSAILGLSSEDDDDGNNVSGYKDSSNSAPQQHSGGLSEAEKENKRQEAIAKAEAKKQSSAVTKEENKNESASTSEEKISPAQVKAIDNMLNILARKEGSGFNKEEYLNELLSNYEVSDVKEISTDDAREVIAKINAKRSGR